MKSSVNGKMRFLSQRSWISASLIFALFMTSTSSAPVTEQLSADKQLQQLASASKVDTLQAQLQKFQSELETLKKNNSALPPLEGLIQSHMEKPSELEVPVLAPSENRQRPQVSQTLGTWGNYLTRPKIPLDGTFYDKPVQLNKRLYERRQIGLQPFRRRGLSEPQLQLSLFDSSDLRQEVINAVEEHLLRDLEAAKTFGIPAEEILQDLRQKQTEQTSQ